MTTPAKKLTVGRGLSARITKAGKAAQERFNALVVEHLKSIGAVPEQWYGWRVETTVGPLLVGPRGNWIAQKFEDWERAKAAGFRHWKWNFHYDIGAAEAEVYSWKLQLAPWLVKVGGAP